MKIYSYLLIFFALTSMSAVQLAQIEPIFHKQGPLPTMRVSGHAPVCNYNIPALSNTNKVLLQDFNDYVTNEYQYPNPAMLHAKFVQLINSLQGELPSLKNDLKGQEILLGIAVKQKDIKKQKAIQSEIQMITQNQKDLVEIIECVRNSYDAEIEILKRIYGK